MMDGQTSSPRKKPRGRHPEKRLTAVRVRALKAPGRYADGNGLYLFVDASGAKRWVLRTVVLGKRRDMGLGSAQLVSLLDARDEAARFRRLARSGGDPLADRRKSRVIVPTLRAAAKAVHESHAGTFRNPKHRADWISSLEMHVFPSLATERVDTITSADVLMVLGEIWLAKPETARRVRQRLRTIFDWAKASGFRAGDNPVDGVGKVLPRHKGDKAHHAAMAYAEVPAFIEALQKAAAGEPTKLAFEFLVLTAARTSEVIGARWDEVDLDSATWTVPASRIKAGREHRVPLSPRCVEILTRAKEISDGGPYLFSGRYAETPLSNTVFLMLLRRLKKGDVTGHGFRSAFRDWAAERTNFPRMVCEAALAHVVKDKTEAAYFRSDLFDQRRALMDSWAAFATTKKANVLPMRA
ncbi:site-specific integrase [Luteitalea sp.]|uniref:tyrosine-type recombinase/integrase n=1 Tax=Luteitalea sp. TaxID=2004800 RepID=UPI0025C50694|nr:site-specific integrase [Luteitalea sp.]